MFLGLFIMFIFLVAFFIKRSDKKQESVNEAFWQRENEANHARRQDISGLPYITIPLDKFPIGIMTNSELLECERTLKELSTQRILNLGTQSNTDLKLQYGPANLEELSACDQRFATLCATLVDYARTLLALGYEKEAQQVLEFGIACGSDHSQNFRMLADQYVKNGQKEQLDSLRHHAGELDSPMKHSILSYLDSLS